MSALLIPFGNIYGALQKTEADPRSQRWFSVAREG